MKTRIEAGIEDLIIGHRRKINIYAREIATICKENPNLGENGDIYIKFSSFGRAIAETSKQVDIFQQQLDVIEQARRQAADGIFFTEKDKELNPILEDEDGDFPPSIPS